MAQTLECQTTAKTLKKRTEGGKSVEVKPESMISMFLHCVW